MQSIDWQSVMPCQAVLGEARSARRVEEKIHWGAPEGLDRVQWSGLCEGNQVAHLAVVVHG